MNKLNAKLIVSDFDGTLITSDQKILPAVREAIDGYVAAGGVFAVCTGRILPSILPRVRALGLEGLVIACQGTVIADIQSGKLVRCGGLEPGQAAEICAAIEEAKQSVNVYCGDDFYSDIPADNRFLKIYEDIIGVRAKHADVPLSRFVAERGAVCQKVASLCAPADRQPLYELLCRRFAGRYDVTCSAEVLVEVAPLGDTKGAALEFLAKRCGIDMSETVAIGDNLNDLSMIVAAGTGVAVGNAVDELKAAADFISLSNDEGAVAQVINKFGWAHD